MVLTNDPSGTTYAPSRADQYAWTMTPLRRAAYVPPAGARSPTSSTPPPVLRGPGNDRPGTTSSISSPSKLPGMSLAHVQDPPNVAFPSAPYCVTADRYGLATTVRAAAVSVASSAWPWGVSQYRPQ